MERLEPIRISRHRGIGIAQDDGQYFLVQSDGEFEGATVETFDETIARTGAFGIKVDASTGSELLATALQGSLRIIGFDHDVAQDLATDTEQGGIKDAFLGCLPHVTWQTDHEHYVHGGLMIANDNTRRGKRLRRDIAELELSEGESFYHSARHPSGSPAQ